MSTTEIFQLVLAVLAVMAGIRLLRLAPVAALVVVCLAAGAVKAGIVELPRPEALDRAAGTVAAWQERQAATISCHVASQAVLDRTPEQALALVERHCGRRRD